MRDAFCMGGWGMYPTLVFGLLMIAASVRYAVRPEGRFVPLQVSLGLVTFLAGSLGFVTGVIKSFLAMGQVAPDNRWIWLLGTGEALNCVGLALTLLIIAALAASVGALRIARGAPEPAEA
jgi:hypothetical protein